MCVVNRKKITWENQQRKGRDSVRNTSRIHSGREREDGNSSRKRREKLFSYLRLVSSLPSNFCAFYLSPHTPTYVLKTTRNSWGARCFHVTARLKVNNVICSENMMEKRLFYIASLLVNLKRSLENNFKR